MSRPCDEGFYNDGSMCAGESFQVTAYSAYMPAVEVYTCSVGSTVQCFLLETVIWAIIIMDCSGESNRGSFTESVDGNM